MSIVFNKITQHANDLKQILCERASVKDETHAFPWDNFVFESENFRRAHLDVVDRRESKKLFMMHLCIFPKTNNPAPIYGFDIIAGQNKVTGAFLDFSPIGDKEHPYCQWFAKEVKELTWSKPRNLPEWAKNIFSNRMVAAGNISTEEELEEIFNLSKRTLLYYLDNFASLEYGSQQDYRDKQNYYCVNQKSNPHTPRVMQSLGYSPEIVKDFIETCLFPEV